MAGDTFGHTLQLTTFGESHGRALGAVLSGMPSGIAVDEDFIQSEMDRRRPGRDRFSTQRQEADRLEILSGVFDGMTTGAPIGMMILNSDQRSRDYDELKDVFRPGHADYTYWCRYTNVDHRGGGRSSGRETSMRVAGGAFAKLLLRREGIRVDAGVRAIGGVSDDGAPFAPPFDNPIHAVDPAMAGLFEAEIDRARQEKDSVGGIIECRVTGVPCSLGEPIFDKLDAQLAAAIMSIGACKGVEIGAGFRSAAMRGSSCNDRMYIEDGRPVFRTNNCGGILGGISTGEEIVLRAAFKPTPSISLPQDTVTRSMQERVIEIHGRHDPCIVVRALVVVEAMTALVIADNLLRARSYGD